MNTAISEGFTAELARIAEQLRTSTIWPSPAIGLAHRILVFGQPVTPLPLDPSKLVFPVGLIDDAPEIAAAGYAMNIWEPSPDELARWRTGIRRLAKRQPFPRDRQTFAFRPAELIGIGLGIARSEPPNSEAVVWFRKLIQDLPSKNPPGDVWVSLLYQYAASLVGVKWSMPPTVRLAEFDIAELSLLLVLRSLGMVDTLSEFGIQQIEEALLQRAVMGMPRLREAEKLAAIYAGLSFGLRAHVSPMRCLPPPTSVIPAMKTRILFLSANPNGTTQLALDRECREIESKIRASEHRDVLELVTKWAVRPTDLLQYLHQHTPHIVHFSGHGSKAEELFLLDQQGQPKPVSKAALKQLFLTLKDNIKVVVLNACFSRSQGETITEVIDCAVGMKRAIGDSAAITFAAAFYQALGFGRSVKVAFESGRTALMLEGIPEEDTPELLVRNGIDAGSIFPVVQR